MTGKSMRATTNQSAGAGSVCCGSF